jgi:hypothetical protein
MLSASQEENTDEKWQAKSEGKWNDSPEEMTEI